MRFQLIILLFLLSSVCHAQLIDNFSDGDFDKNPEWFGNTGSFMVNNSKQLQLDTSGSAVKYLTTTNSRIENTEWNFWLKLNFDPSASNQVKIYLCSDNHDVTKPLNGYFIRIGENLALDDIDLVRQTGTTEQVIIDGIDGRAAKSPTLRIKVLCDDKGNWKLLCDTTGKEQYLMEGSGFDTMIKNTSFFGFSCKFTSSNAKNFFFDDFYIGNERKDTIGPEILQIVTLGFNKLQIVFNEDIDTSNLKATDFYIASNLNFYPSFKLEKIDLKTFVIFINPDNYYLYISPNILFANNIYDLLGNKSIPIKTFIHYRLSKQDLVINEFMADPSPPLSLPDAEFIELFNNLNVAYPLTDITLEDLSTKIELKDSIPAKSFVILCKTTDTSLFIPYGKTIGVNIPSLNNSNDVLVLKSKSYGLLDSLNYDLSWYKDQQKSEGGWSLERVFPYQSCIANKDNFEASNSTDGGTPGKKNSVFDSLFKNNFKWKYELSMLNDSTFEFIVNQQIINDGSLSVKIICLEDTISKINVTTTIKHNSLIINLDKAPVKNRSYSMSVALHNCEFKLFYLDTTLYIAAEMDSFDLIINEILFNPKPNSYDFIELYNRSNKYLNLKNLQLARLDDSLKLKDIKTVFTKDFVLLPGQYLVLTENIEDIKNQYFVKNPQQLIKASITSMPDDKGDVILLYKNRRIDYFHYEESYHFEALRSSEGVSLERIGHNLQTQISSNWHSAASSVGYATPTYQNSQFDVFNPTLKEVFADKNIFSPDNDGFDDFLLIQYNFANTGNFGSIKIYDLAGRLVRELVNNDLFGSTGFYQWDGVDDNGKLLNSGVYIILAEIINVSGKSVKYKLSCSLIR